VLVLPVSAAAPVGAGLLRSVFCTFALRPLAGGVAALFGRLKSMTMMETSKKSGRLPVFRQPAQKL
jgi:hypothetical protein